MSCQVDNCKQKVVATLYFQFGKEKGKPWGEVCDEHTSLSKEEIVLMAAKDQIIQGYAEVGQEKTKYDEIGTMTLPL